MSDVRDLLIEIGSEELPPKALKKLMQAFEAGIKQGLEKANLSFQLMVQVRNKGIEAYQEMMRMQV